MSEPSIDPDYRIVAKAILERQYRHKDGIQSYVVELAKWLLATLTLINGGALISLIQGGPAAHSSLRLPGVCFVAGIVSSTLCGFFAWINSQNRDRAFSKMIDEQMLVSIDHWPTKSSKTADAQIAITYYCARILGLSSLALFIYGAYVVSKTLL